MRRPGQIGREGPGRTGVGVHGPLGPVARAVAFTTATARADEPPSPDEPQASDDASRHRIDRTWLYADDALVAAPMTVVGTSSLSYTNVGSSISRVASPFPNVYNGFAANTAQPGGMISVGGEVGIIAPL